MKNVVFTLALMLSLLANRVGVAERPNAMRLFPSRTVFFVRTPDGSELVRKFSESPLFQDPEIAPFIQALFGKVDEAYRSGDAGEATGGGLGDLFALSQGEVAFGVIPRNNESPAILLLADSTSPQARDASDAVAIADGEERLSKLIEALKAKGAQEGDRVATEPIGSVEATVFRNGDRVRESLGVVERQGVLVLSNDRILLESAIKKWDESEGANVEVTEEEPAKDDEAKRTARLRQRYAESLSSNEAYTESLRECVEERIGGGDNEPPILSAFVDPVGIFRAIAQRNNGMRVALATLPVLGLDGVEGGAAAMWIDHGDWDSLLRAHLLLDNPRSGILKMVRLLPCDTTPSETIPADVASYQCGSIDFGATLSGAGQLYDRIRGEGEFAKLVERNVTKKVGVSPETLFEKMTGRFVSIQGYGENSEDGPVRVTPARAFLFNVNDAEWAMAIVREVLEKTEVPVEWQTHAGVEYAMVKGGNRRRPWSSASLTVIEDQLVLAETPALLQKLIDTQAGVGDRLVSHLPYRLTASRAKRLGRASVGTQEGRLLSYNDPGSQFEQWHAAGNSDASREQLDKLADRAPPMRWLRDALDETGVPPLEALMRHAAPSGSAVYDTPRGFRFVQFAFKLGDD